MLQYIPFPLAINGLRINPSLPRSFTLCDVAMISRDMGIYNDEVRFTPCLELSTERRSTTPIRLATSCL